MVLNQFFAELTTTNDIIVVGLIYKSCVDISTENFKVELDPLISSFDPRVKPYKMGDFNINCWITIFRHQLKILSIKLSPKIYFQSLLAPLE